MRAPEDFFIWTPDGVWLQHKEASDRPVTISYVGQISLTALQVWATSHGMVVHTRRNHPHHPSTPESSERVLGQARRQDFSGKEGHGV